MTFGALPPETSDIDMLTKLPLICCRAKRIEKIRTLCTRVLQVRGIVHRDPQFFHPFVHCLAGGDPRSNASSYHRQRRQRMTNERRFRNLTTTTTTTTAAATAAANSIKQRQPERQRQRRRRLMTVENLQKRGWQHQRSKDCRVALRAMRTVVVRGRTWPEPMRPEPTNTIRNNEPLKRRAVPIKRK